MHAPMIYLYHAIAISAYSCNNNDDLIWSRFMSVPSSDELRAVWNTQTKTTIFSYSLWIHFWKHLFVDCKYLPFISTENAFDGSTMRQPNKQRNSARPKAFKSWRKNFDVSCTCYACVILWEQAPVHIFEYADRNVQLNMLVYRWGFACMNKCFAFKIKRSIFCIHAYFIRRY